MSTAIPGRASVLLDWSHLRRFPLVRSWHACKAVSNGHQYDGLLFEWESLKGRGTLLFERTGVKMLYSFAKVACSKDLVPALMIVRHGDFATILFWINRKAERSRALESSAEHASSSGQNGTAFMPTFREAWPPRGALTPLFDSHLLAVVGICFEQGGRSFSTLREIFKDLGYTVFEFPSWRDYWQAIDSRRW